jgi:Tol biopolymer transport system component
MINADGTGERRLSFGASDEAPTWSPLPNGRSDAGISIEIAPNDLQLAPGEARQFTATVRSTSGAISHTVTWSSSAPAVATVLPSGLVTAIANGVGQIRATFGGETAGAEVRVVERVLRNAIVYSTDEFGAAEYAVVRPDGSARRRLTTDQIGYDTPPDLSPDGRRILFAKVFSIFAMDVDVAGLSEGYTEVMFDVDNPPSVPVWSPDGTQIAFVSGGRVFVINSDGSGRRQVSPDAPTADDAPTWSPDGTRLVFTRGGVLQVINTDGTGLSSLGNSDPASEPDWSPDGSRIAYASGGGIRIRSADGSHLMTVTMVTGDAHPRWAPESQRLVFARVVAGQSQLFIINVDGTGERQLSAGSAGESTPSWSPLP